MRRALLAGVAALLAFAPGVARAADPPAFSTEVEVGPLALAIYSVSATVVQPALPAGFTVRPCFGGGEADVIVMVTQERYLDLPSVREPARQLSLMTCATPPDALVRDDATEPPFFLLASFTDSEQLRRRMLTLGVEPGVAAIDLEGSDGVTSFRAVARDGSVIATGNTGSPRVGDPLGLFPCTPAPTAGRVISPAGDGFVALDFDKIERVCAGAGLVRWDATSPLAAFLGAANVPLFVVDTQVDDAHYTFRRVP